MKPADTPPEVFRLGRMPDPWSWPDWAYAEADGTFGNRYDDHRGTYRVLYASTQRQGTFVECLAYFRPDIEVVAELNEITGEASDEEPPGARVVPTEWITRRCLGRAALAGDYADIGHHESIGELRAALAARAVHHALPDLDAATIRLSAPRGFTQDVSRYVFDQTAEGHRRWNGIAYLSRHGDDIQNWAIFEPAAPDPVDTEDVAIDDPDLNAALALHNLRLE